MVSVYLDVMSIIFSELYYIDRESYYRDPLPVFSEGSSHSTYSTSLFKGDESNFTCSECYQIFISIGHSRTNPYFLVYHYISINSSNKNAYQLNRTVIKSQGPGISSNNTYYLRYDPPTFIGNKWKIEPI